MNYDSPGSGYNFPRFTCPLCRTVLRRREHAEIVPDIPTPKTGEELLRFASNVLPECLPLEIQEEARQNICLDLIGRVVVAGALLNIRYVRRRYVNPLYGMNNRFKFASLDAPVRAGSSRTLGETMHG
jgi:hypothetical protein